MSEIVVVLLALGLVPYAVFVNFVARLVLLHLVPTPPPTPIELKPSYNLYFRKCLDCGQDEGADTMIQDGEDLTPTDEE